MIRTLFGLALLTSAVTGTEPTRYAVEARDVKRVLAELSWDISCLKLKASEWTVFATAAPELPSQSKPKTTMLPAGVKAKDDAFGRSVLTLKVPAKTPELKTALSVRLTYEATLRSRKLVAVADDAPSPKVAPLTAAESKRYLADRGDVDFKKPEFQKWLDANKLRRGEGESDVDLGRRVFLKIRELGRYHFRRDAERAAFVLCEDCKTDCGGFSVLFAAAMRANAVPARVLVGRWAESADPDQKLGKEQYYQWHVKAEFFAAGVGWVPVDLAGAVEHDKSKDGLRYFGDDKGDFLTMHVDPNFELDGGAFGMRKVPILQSPIFLASGEGEVTPLTVAEGWKVKVLK